MLAAAMLWGTMGTAQAFAPEGYDPRTIGALRLLVGGGALFAASAWRNEFAPWRAWHWGAVAFCALALAGFQYAFFAAVHRAGVAAGTMVAIGSFPVFGALLARVFLGEVLGLRWCFATGLAVAGCVLICLGGEAGAAPEAGQANLTGILLALTAGFLYAAYTLCMKKLVRRHPPASVVALMGVGGAALMLPELLRCDPAWLFQGRTLAVALYLGLISMAAPFFLFAQGLKRLPVSTTTTLVLAEPLTAVCLGLLLLGERLGGAGLTGLALVFCGLMVLALAKPNDERAGQGGADENEGNR